MESRVAVCTYRCPSDKTKSRKYEFTDDSEEFYTAINLDTRGVNVTNASYYYFFASYCRTGARSAYLLIKQNTTPRAQVKADVMEDDSVIFLAREINILRQISHRNIVKLYDVALARSVLLRVHENYNYTRLENARHWFTISQNEAKRGVETTYLNLASYCSDDPTSKTRSTRESLELNF